MGGELGDKGGRGVGEGGKERRRRNVKKSFFLAPAPGKTAPRLIIY